MKPVWSVLLCATLAFSAPYVIDKFSSTEEYGSPDDYIAAEFNGELKKASPNAIREGRFYIRQKYEDPFDDEATTYQLFEGKMTPAGKAKLGKFSYPEKPYSEMLKMKFYTSKNARPDQDIERVYFDGKFFYVEGENPVYINVDGQMIELKPSVEKVSYLDLSSQPSGAEVWINGESRGTTPTKISVTGTRPVVVVLKKSGYYTTIRLLKPRPGSTLQDGALLIKKTDLENIAEPLRQKYLEFSRKNDTKALQALRDQIQAALTTWPGEAAVKIEKILNNYPPNPAQGSDEPAEDYQARTKAWEEERNAEQNALKASSEQIAKNLQDLLNQVNQVLENASFGLKHIYVPPSAIQIGRVDRAKKTFEFSIDHSTNDVQFSYKGVADLGDMTPADLVREKERMQAVLKVWAIASPSGKYPIFRELVLFLNKTPIAQKSPGTYQTPDASAAIIASKGAPMEEKLKNLPISERSAFENSDRQATEALLQDFSPQPVAPPPPPPTPATEPVKPQHQPRAQVSPDENEEEEGEEDTEDIDIAEPDQTAVARSVAREASANDAIRDVDDVFDRSDEYRRWSAWALSLSSAGTLTAAVLQHMKYQKAKKNYDNTQQLINEHINSLRGNPACLASVDPQRCTDALIAASRNDPDGFLHIAEPIQAENKKVVDSYSRGRNIFLGLTALGVAGSVVLFTW